MKCEAVEFNPTFAPTCLAVNKHPFKQPKTPDIPSDLPDVEDVNLLIGTRDGCVYNFDPIHRGKLTIKKYSYDFEKKRQVELVKWLEKSPTRPFSSRFVVVYSDGTIAIYHKDKDIANTMTNPKDGSQIPYDPEKDLMKVPGSSDQSVSKL